MNFISDLFQDLFLVNIAYASFDSVLASINRHILNPLIYLLFAVAFVVFTYGVVMFIANLNNEGERGAGKKHMLFGIIGLTIMFSVWALINIVISTFKIEGIEPKSNVKDSVKLGDFDLNFPQVGPNDNINVNFPP